MVVFFMAKTPCDAPVEVQNMDIANQPRSKKLLIRGGVALILVAFIATAIPTNADHLDGTPLATQEETNVGYDPRDNDSDYDLADLYDGDTFVVEHGLSVLGVDFHILTPNEPTGETGFDNFALLFDMDDDGRADIQFTYKAWENDPWGSQTSFDNEDACGWEDQEIPSSVTVAQEAADHFVVSVPLELLLEGGLDYSYAVLNINHGPQTPLEANDAQVHMTIPETDDLFDGGPETCWYSSANYQSETFGTWGL